MKDFEKKYKDLVKAVKELQEANPSDEGIQNWVNDNVPELKESEGESIRKAIVSGMTTLKEQGKETFATININDCIAWLEKQGEPTEINPSEFDSQLNRLLKQFESLPKEELVSSLSFYLNVVQNDGTYNVEEKQGKQKPVEKEFTFKSIPRLLEMVEPTERAKNYAGKLADTLESEGYTIDAKIVRESIKIMNGEKVPMATMDEHKHAWSEEDEKMLEYALDMIEWYSDKNEDKSRLVSIWLKSLKDKVHPQNTWKPSEEQMKILFKYAEQNNYDGSVLTSLYQDLKKLMEE